MRPEKPLRPYGLSLEEYIGLYVDQTPEPGCWLWKGPIMASTGYGYAANGGYRGSAHTFMFQHFVGPVPEGMELDHVCHSADLSCQGGLTCPHRPCVRPDHLEIVTSAENVRRSQSPWGRNARKTHCKHGHPFSGDNLIVTREGYRQCRACCNRRLRESRARRKAAA